MAIGRKSSKVDDASTPDHEISNEPHATGQDVARRRALDDIVPEIMGSSSSFSEDLLRTAESFDDFVRLTQDTHGEIADAGLEIGDGFSLLNDKNILVGRPCLFMEWTFRAGDFAAPYVSVRVVAQFHGGALGKFIFNDGSTGIAEQLAKYQKNTGKTGGLAVKQGLRRSDYEVEIDGRMSPATTFYIDTATV